MVCIRGRAPRWNGGMGRDEDGEGWEEEEREVFDAS